MSKGIGKKLSEPASTALFLQTMLDNTGQMGGLEAITIGFERLWAESDRHAIFIKDTNVYNNLSKGKFDITSIEALDIPFKSAIIHFPNDLKIQCGDKLITPPAVLVSIATTDERRDMMCGLYPNRRINFVDEAAGVTVSLSYPDPFEKPISGFINTVRSNLRMPLSELQECLDNPLEYLADLFNREHRNASATHKPFMKDMQQPDMQLQAAYLRLVASLIVYVNANPKALQDGLPQGVKLAQIAPSKSLMPKSGYTFADDTLSGDSRSVHFRRWHLRQLWHDRFYHGEHEGKQAGSRVVFVKASMVGDAKPLTVV